MFLCNDPRAATAQGQDGFCMMHHDIVTRPTPRVVMQKNMSENNKHKIALISGGGAGHEPFASGFVGRGMITASVAGDLYSSPPTKAVEAAMNACFDSGYESALVMVNNYTGDRLTFGLAQRRSPKATLHIIADDCTTKSLRIGPRGLPGNLFHYKIAGAMVENGSTMAALKEEMDSICPRVQTIGVCLRACSLPGRVGPILDIEHGYAELGLGVHGEAGVEKVKVTSCDALVAKMIDKLMESLTASNQSTERTALHLNNLGGMSQVELSLVVRSALHCLHDKYSIRPIRLYVGAYMTSLDAKGFTLSIFLANNDTEIGYLDAPTEAPAWVPTCALPPFEQLSSDYKVEETEETAKEIALQMPRISENVANIMRRICNRVIEMTDRLNFLDSRGLGDGDTGSTLAQMYRRILSDIEKNIPEPNLETSLEMVVNYLYYLSEIAETEMGGTSGGLYASGLQAAGDTLKLYISGEKKAERGNKLAVWSDAVSSALKAVQFLGGAQPGDRSLVDPLNAIVKSLVNEASREGCKSALPESGKAGEKAAESTAEMKAHVGRAAAAREVGNVGDAKTPDPGATALAAMWSELIANQ